MKPTSSFTIPKPVSCLRAYSESSLLVGSEDGCLRLYDLISGRVRKAIKGLNDEISSVLYATQKNDGTEVIWLASGIRVLCFQFGDTKMILSPEDSKVQIQVGEDGEDLVNEIAINHNNAYLAFGTDAGAVGVIDLSSSHVSIMRARHENICGSVSFIPDRPNELISGGYDSVILHFDFLQGSLLSRFDIASSPPGSGVSLSPPFVLTISLSASGIIAAGTADGRVWIGAGGGKASSGGKKKKSRKWEGLTEDEGLWLNVAEGPVVAVSFTDSMSLLTCSLLGTLIMLSLTKEDDHLTAKQLWTVDSKNLAKVNAMSIDGEKIIVGGFTAEGRGIFDIWSIKDAALVVT